MASDSDSDEDFVSYGTPLEPLEEDEPARKPVPVHEQTVKDEKGRYKRFHGAFTGGFSAGYFNTVGSKEGWTPSTFVSSRQQKVERQSARPEDFMDEEDLGEHGIAPDQITTTADFGSGCIDPIQEKARTLSAQSGPIPGDTLLHDLIAPARTSVGVALLRKMGWREGQGVGPRVRKRKMHHKADAGERVYGCALPPEGSAESEGDSDDEFAPEDVTFAPRDVTPQVWVGKQDLHGLGYRGLDPSRALPAHTSRGQHINLFTLASDSTSSLLGLSHTTHTRRGVAGQAFDEDDESVYHRDSMSNYDSVLGGEEPGDGLYGWTAPQQYRSKSKDSKRDAAYLGKILEGFTLASNAEEPKTVFGPPVLPRDYRPLRRYRPLLDTSGLSPLLAAALRDSRGHMTQPQQAIGRHQLDSAQRRELLGETSLQGPSSVFDLLRPEDQEKLSSVRKAADGRRDVPEPSSQSGGPPEGRRGVPDLTSQSGRAAVVAAAKASALQALSSRFQGRQQGAPEGQSGAMEGHKGAPESQALAAWSAPTADTNNIFKPFDKNPHKQARYDQYLSLLRQGHKDALERSLDVCMTEWERGREREEFVRAALLYKPSSSALSTRFTRSTHTEDDSSVEVTQDAESDVNDKESAVKMKMFGKLTRDTFQWHPHTLLCKRFNIPDPYPGSGVVGMPKVKRDRFSVFNFLTVNESPTAAHSPASSSSGGAECSKAAEAGRRSRWDVTAPPAGQEDPLTQLLTQARNQASVPTHTHTTAEASQVEQSEGAEKKSGEEKDGEGEGEEEREGEEEGEEERPSMDLFKAIFSSSDSSSSDQSDGEEQEQETNQDTAEAGPHPPGPISFSSIPQATPTLTPPAPTYRNTTAIGHAVLEGRGQMDGRETEAEFGPRLPPPTSTIAPPTSKGVSPVREEGRRRRSKEKHKAKKEHKHKKVKKKKKQKRGRHKGKERRRRERREESSSSAHSEDDEDEDVSTEELLRRLKSIKGKV